jgi:Ser/Thr protein kinase RdoA (MazF antagonist)
VAEVLPLSEAELQLLETLIRHKIRFMVVGLSAAALQGAPVVTEDIDLWFDNLSDPKLMQALVKVGAAYIPPFGYNPPMLGGAGSDPFDLVVRMDGLGEFADEWKHALEIKIGKLKLKVLPLERILASKQAANRPKDQRVIPVLQNSLRTLQARQKLKTRRPVQRKTNGSK